MSDDFYRAFEERYRGSRELIKSRQRVYLPFIEPLLSFYKDAQAIDLGCGRGEWLELLKESGFDGHGVDLDDGMLAACREHGLSVVTQDAISALKALPDESQIIVSGFHIAEHIQFSDLQLLVQEALRVLKPAGLLILETPNPENITVGTVNFYLDPTHQRPIPPLLLSFLPEHYGFVRVKVMRLQEDKSLAGKAWTSLRDVLGGVSPDYAVVAQKSADAPLLDGTSDAFAREYGLTLDVLVEKFDQQAQQVSDRAAQAEAQAQQASDRAAQAEAQAQQASDRAAQAEAQAQQASDRAAQAQQAEASLIAIRNSSSWRFTAPIRMVGKQIESLRVNFRSLLALSSINQLARFFRWQAVPKLAEEINPPHVDRQLSTIAVDLTPILPGGENGGAKIFVIELLRHLAEMAPQTNFVLLTQAASHEELSVLDRSNMRRQMIVGPMTANSPRSLMKGLAFRILPHLPNRLRRVVSRVGYKLNTVLKRGGSGLLLRDMRVDLLFCPFTAPTYFEPGIPTVCTVYDLQYKTYPEFFAAEDVAHREHTFIEACRRAAALAAISDYSRDSAITHGNLEPDRIRTIHLRMAQRIAPGVENCKVILDRLGLVPQRYLVYPANFWKHKNHEMLLTAFGIACHAGLPADIKLVCTGAPGARQAWLMNAARTMNLGDRILFPGYLPNVELAALLADCIGLVFPSLYEGFGLPVIEAMAAGVPVACSNTTSLPEVAAEAVILFDPRVPTQIAQAMISLVENDALRARLIQAGLQRAAEFSDTERMAREYWDLFQYALSNEKYENLLTGTYADGWAGPRMSIQVAPEASTRTLELEFSAPEWLPQSPVTIQTTLRGNPQGDPMVLQLGTSVALSLALEPVGGCYDVVITPTFVPARSGHGDDQRELSVILQRCGIVRTDGEYIELFPEKVSA